MCYTQWHDIVHAGSAGVDNPTYIECQQTSRNSTASDDGSDFQREFDNPLFSDETTEVDHDSTSIHG